MMKRTLGMSNRITATLLAFLMLFALVACGTGEEPTEQGTEPPTEEQVTPPAGGGEGTEEKEEPTAGSLGLTYANSQFGSTCYVTGIGTCKDKTVVVPTKNENGGTVIGINAGAFSGDGCAQITEIRIPDSVKKLEAGAFDFEDCASLKTIRYFGTETMWEEMMATAEVEAFPETVEVVFSTYCELTVEYLYLDGTEAKATQVHTYINGETFRVWRPEIEGYRADTDTPVGVITEDVTVTVYYTKALASGTCGEGLTWTVYENGEMRIAGEGVMDDYLTGATPWAPYLGQISVVVFEDTVKSVGAYAFADCTAIERLELPADLEALGANAFRGWTAQQTVLFRGGVDILVFADAVWNSGAEAQISFLYGEYEQDGKQENGKEPIEWALVEQDGGAYLLTTVYALEMMPYHTRPTDVTWETSSLRAWIKDTFIAESFTDDEKAIQTTKQKDIGTDNDTVFLLSASDVAVLFEDENERLHQATVAVNPLEIENEDGTTSVVQNEETVYWWLRDGGDLGQLAQNVSPTGVVNTMGTLVSAEDRGVVLAVWVQPAADQ